MLLRKGCRVGASANGVRVVEADGDTNDGNEELADQHAEGTPDENGRRPNFSTV